MLTVAITRGRARAGADRAGVDRARPPRSRTRCSSARRWCCVRADAVSPGKFLVLVEGERRRRSRSRSASALDVAGRSPRRPAVPAAAARRSCGRRWRGEARGGRRRFAGRSSRRRPSWRRWLAADAAVKAARVRHHRDAARARHRRQGVLHRDRPAGRGRGRRRGGGGRRRAERVYTTEIIAAPHTDLAAKLR